MSNGCDTQPGQREHTRPGWVYCCIFCASAHRCSSEAVDSVEQHEKGCHMRSMIVSHLERRRPYSERNFVVLRIALSSKSGFHNASTIEGLIDKDALPAHPGRPLLEVQGTSRLVEYLGRASILQHQ